MFRKTLSLVALAFLALCITQISHAEVSSGSASQAGSLSGAAAGVNYTDSRTFEGTDVSRNVPSLWVPGPGGGGANPCVISTGAGAVGGGWGFGFSKGYNDHECQIREAMKVLSGTVNTEHPIAQPLMKNVACQSDIYQEAFRLSGDRCANDPAPRARGTSSKASGAAAAYAACRKVSDADYAACMRRARQS